MQRQLRRWAAPESCVCILPPLDFSMDFERHSKAFERYQRHHISSKSAACESSRSSKKSRSCSHSIECRLHHITSLPANQADRMLVHGWTSGQPPGDGLQDSR